MKVLTSKIVNGKKMFLIEDNNPQGKVFAQVGKPIKKENISNYNPYYVDVKGLNASESTKTNLTPATKITPQEIKKIKESPTNVGNIKIKEAQEKAQRLKEAEEAYKKRKAGAPITPELLAQETQAIGDKISLQNIPGVGQYIPDMLDVTGGIGSMASNLGALPLNLNRGNYGQALLSVAAPLATGALAGIGTQNTGQFINNIANPLAGIKDYSKDIYYTSKMKNKLSLPEYDNVFRWQPDKVPQNIIDSGLKNLTPEQHSLQGSWYTKLPYDLPFYMRTRYGAGEIKHIKLPKYKIKELETTMPDFAKGMSGKQNTLSEDTNFKFGELILPKDLRTKTKNIRVENNPTSAINEEEIKSNLLELLYGRLQTPEQYLKTYEKIQNSPLEQAILEQQARNYLKKEVLNKLDKPILGIDRKFFPFQFGGKIEQDNKKKVVKIFDTKIENNKKYYLINE